MQIKDKGKRYLFPKSASTRQFEFDNLTFRYVIVSKEYGKYFFPNNLEKSKFKTRMLYIVSHFFLLLLSKMSVFISYIRF